MDVRAKYLLSKILKNVPFRNRQKGVPKLEHYHKRSNVKTTFSMIKAKFGGNLRSKTRTAQINEALCKVLAHNICVLIQSMHEFGIKWDFRI